MRVAKNQIVDTTYHVAKYANGKFCGIVSGMGRNAGTWDSEAKSKRTAQRWAAILRREDTQSVYTVEEN